MVDENLWWILIEVLNGFWGLDLLYIEIKKLNEVFRSNYL